VSVIPALPVFACRLLVNFGQKCYNNGMENKEVEKRKNAEKPMVFFMILGNS